MGGKLDRFIVENRNINKEIDTVIILVNMIKRIQIKEPSTFLKHNQYHKKGASTEDYGC